MDTPNLTEPVDFDVYLTAADIDGTFPPTRFRDRDRRLHLLNALWRGDLGAWGIPPTAGLNYFHAYSTKLANLLLMSPPLVGTPDAGSAEEPTEMIDEQVSDERLNLSDVAYDGLIDMTRYGLAALAVVDNQVEVIDPLTIYPDASGGWWSVHPYISSSAQSPEPDRARVKYYGAGSGIEQDREYSRGQVGTVLAERVFLTTGIVTVQRTPRIGIWGTATYTEIAAPIIEINRRAAKNSDLLDQYSGPIAVQEMSDVDAEARWPAEQPRDPDAPTDAERRAAIVRGVREDFAAGYIQQRDEVVGLSFLQPDVSGVMTSLAQVDEMRTAIQSLTGLPSLAGEYQPPSGEALKRMFLPFYAESSALQESMRLALEELFGEPVEWEHVFDVLETQARNRMMENAQALAAMGGDDDDEDDAEDL